MAHRGSFNALLFLLLALLLILAPTLAQSQAAYSGTWNGRTAQHEPITLIIDGRTLRAVIVRVHIHGSEPAHCTGEVLFIASNYDTGMYYINNSEIDLFWEEDGAQLALQAFIDDQGRAYGTLHLQTTPGEYPPPLCHGAGRANFSAGIGVPYESGRPSSPTNPPPAAPAPPVATAPAAPAAPAPTARPGEPQAPTTRPTRIPEPIPTDTPTVPVEGENCSPSYPDFCLPPPPPDKNCPEVVAIHGCGFRVNPPDPHGLDRENDGIGCECTEP